MSYNPFYSRKKIIEDLLDAQSYWTQCPEKFEAAFRDLLQTTESAEFYAIALQAEPSSNLQWAAARFYGASIGNAPGSWFKDDKLINNRSSFVREAMVEGASDVSSRWLLECFMNDEDPIVKQAAQEYLEDL